MSKKVFVTGSNGQLGSEIKELSQNSINEFTFHDIDTLDITDFGSLEKKIIEKRPDFLINCAAYTAVDKAETEKELAEKINVIGAKNISVLSEQHKFRMIHISTDYVFDGDKTTPYAEEDKPNPLSIYGMTKLSSEIEVMENNKENIIIRTSWLYSNFGNNFVKTILRLAKERDEIKVVADQYGTPTNANDLAEAILKIIDNNNFVPGIYHYSNEGIASWYDFACAIIGFSKQNTKVIPIKTSEYPTLAKRPKYSVLDKTKIKKIYNPTIKDWKESLKSLF